MCISMISQSFQFPRILVCGVELVDRGQPWPCSSWRLTEKYSRESQHFRQRQSFAEVLTLTVPSVAATEWQILMYSVVLRKPASLPGSGSLLCVLMMLAASFAV